MIADSEIIGLLSAEISDGRLYVRLLRSDGSVFPVWWSLASFASYPGIDEPSVTPGLTMQ